MARDLFADTFTVRPAPSRSKWTILGSFLVHVGVVGALLVVPILSAFDSFVVQARNLAFVAPPAPVIPAMPAAPPKATPSLAPEINPAAAPRQSPQEPVTGDVTPVVSGPPAPPGMIFGDGGTAVDRLLRPNPGVPSATLGTPPGPPEPVRPGGNIRAPSRLVYVEPVYPAIAQAAKVEGMVILEATIDESGVVRDVKVLRSIPLLDQAAVDAVSRWRYTPTRLNGAPVPVLLTVTVTFSRR